MSFQYISIITRVLGLQSTAMEVAGRLDWFNSNEDYMHVLTKNENTEKLYIQKQQPLVSRRTW